MESLTFSVLFATFLAISVMLHFWLASRQIRHVLAHRAAVPTEFAERIGLDAHQKAADYTIANTKFSLVTLLFSTATLVGFTLLGGLQWLSGTLLAQFGPGMVYQMALLIGFGLLSSLLDAPFEYWHQFVLEQKFGFNKMTRRLFFLDQIKGYAIGILVFAPLGWVVLSLMEQAGDLWWLYAWMALCGFQFLMLALYPTFIAPLFNKFTPLEDDSLRQRIEGLMQRVGFASKGLFVMDGSKRSAHGNAYFSGFGSNKRIVFYDTLLQRLAPQEIEAVLAHELGHFKLRHIVKRMVAMALLALAFFALLGWFKSQTWFYTGLGVVPLPIGGNEAMALILFMLALPCFTFLLGPLMSLSSRRHEFEADAFAARHSDARDLVSALVKMYEDNSSTLTPDPLHSTFYDSHPPASVRIGRLAS